MDGQVVPFDGDSRKKKPKNSSFRQQTMRAYRPVPTVRSAVFTFSVLGVLFIVIGSILLSYSMEIVEVKQRYDNLGLCEDTKWDTPQNCTVTLEVNEQMKAPVYFYYELHNFYQNHRKYVKSRSDKQLMGNDLSKDELSECEPVVDMEDLGRIQEHLQGAKDLKPSAPANPCGLIAKTFFNDTYSISNSSNVQIKIHEDEIAWPSDREEKFERVSNNWQEKQWVDVEDEHFMVWMRTAGLPNFRKLWGRIEQDIYPGTYYIAVKSFYDVSDFDGEKYVVLSTANTFGGKNDALGIAYIVVGAMTILLAITFTVKGYIYKRSQDIG